MINNNIIQYIYTISMNKFIYVYIVGCHNHHIYSHENFRYVLYIIICYMI